MAKKNTTALLIGLALAGGAAYLLLRRPAATTPPASPSAPYAPTAGTPAPATGGTAGLLSTLISAGKALFGGGSSSPSFTPVSTAAIPTGGGGTVQSPAGGINYINPSAPTLQLPPAVDYSATPDLSFLQDL